MKQLCSNTLNLLPAMVLLFILYRCCFKQMLYLEFTGRVMTQHRRCFVTFHAAVKNLNFKKYHKLYKIFYNGTGSPLDGTTFEHYNI